jgi:hypothetical protein
MRLRWLWLLSVCVLGMGCAAAESPTYDGSVKLEKLERKIVYLGELSISTPDLSKFERQLTAQLQSAGGFIADFHEDRTPQQPRQAQWTLRIPAAKFAETVEAIDKLGTTTRRALHSEDVTDAYVDLESRLKSQKKLETRLLDLIEKNTGNLKEVLAVETELSRVRQEIERLEGQRRAADERIALSTLVLSVIEQADYVALMDATFGERLSRAFWKSINQLITTVQTVIIGLAALLPWIAVICIVLSPVAIFLRRHRQQRSSA